MKLALDKWYPVSELSILNVITMVIKEHHLLPCNLKKLCLLDKNFSAMIQKVLKWLHIDFHLLWEPRYNYKQQERIDTSQVEMTSAAMIHFGLDPSKLNVSKEEYALVIPATSTRLYKCLKIISPLKILPTWKENSGWLPCRFNV